MFHMKYNSHATKTCLTFQIRRDSDASKTRIYQVVPKNCPCFTKSHACFGYEGEPGRESIICSYLKINL